MLQKHSKLTSAGFQHSAFTFLFYNMMLEATAYQSLYEKQVITSGVTSKYVFERERQFTDKKVA